MKSHGGRIWLDKTYTTGASIKFTLPRDDSNSMKVLIVDDNEELTDAVKDFLDSIGIECNSKK